MKVLLDLMRIRLVNIQLGLGLIKFGSESSDLALARLLKELIQT